MRRIHRLRFGRLHPGPLFLDPGPSGSLSQSLKPKARGSIPRPPQINQDLVCKWQARVEVQQSRPSQRWFMCLKWSQNGTQMLPVAVFRSVSEPPSIARLRSHFTDQWQGKDFVFYERFHTGESLGCTPIGAPLDGARNLDIHIDAIRECRS